MNELLCCPFCGGNAELKTYRDKMRGDTVRYGEWISIKDRMPKPMTWILALCARSRNYEIVRFDHINDDWDSVLPNHGYFKDYVTHWMPLQEPPKEE